MLRTTCWRLRSCFFFQILVLWLRIDARFAGSNARNLFCQGWAGLSFLSASLLGVSCSVSSQNIDFTFKRTHDIAIFCSLSPGIRRKQTHNLPGPCDQSPSPDVLLDSCVHSFFRLAEGRRALSASAPQEPRVG
ncbi:hypothetical protein EXIGLDRAFT_283418 [Exidia glandulosa HHB12029]|uniref:Uncharacterized protein n=1 Tax=Exidia glandulosa HHB12029 TaxID=1314781 RepID=A0A165DHW0_EXIGL|nr:hypothetical protein EXIGLDRAFT_283418 [Exidia glandulosa HHB12029]